MITVNWINAFSLVIFASITVFISNKLTKTYIEKIYIICIETGVIVYSGISTVLVDVAENYLLHFIIFNFCLLLSLSSTLYFLRKYKRTKKSKIQYSIDRNILIIALIMFFTYFIYLIVLRNPTIKEYFLLDLRVDNIFSRMKSQRDSNLKSILYYLNLLSFPFFLAYCEYLGSSRKRGLSVFLLLLWFYLDTLSLGYVSRYEIVIFLVFIGLVLNREAIEKNTRLVIHYFIKVGILFILSMPLLLAYQYMRMGSNYSSSGFIDSIIRLFSIETNYGRYYQNTIDMHQPFLFLDFYKWFFTLPIPSFLKDKFISLNFTINTFFTQSITGINYGEQGFSIILPSLLGEAFILYGDIFFWVHGIFLGFYLAIICFFIQKRQDLAIINIYFASMLLSVGRGGTSNILGLTMNSLFSIVLFLKIQKNLKRVL